MTECFDIEELNLSPEQKEVIMAGYPWLLEDTRRSYTTEDLRERMNYADRRAVYRFIANHGIDVIRMFDRSLRIPRLAIIRALLRRNELL